MNNNYLSIKYMTIIKDIILSIPIGLLYYFFFSKLITNSLSNFSYKDKYQKSLILLFIIGLVGLILSFTLFKNHKILKNRVIQFGLILGSILLIFYSVGSNWNKIEDSTKIIICGILLGLLIWYAYFSKNNNKKKNKIKVRRDKR